MQTLQTRHGDAARYSQPTIPTSYVHGLRIYQPVGFAIDKALTLINWTRMSKYITQIYTCNDNI